MAFIAHRSASANGSGLFIVLAVQVPLLILACPLDMLRSVFQLFLVSSLNSGPYSFLACTAACPIDTLCLGTILTSPFNNGLTTTDVTLKYFPD